MQEPSDGIKWENLRCLVQPFGAVLKFKLLGRKNLDTTNLENLLLSFAKH